jgi:hypothetical protein
MAQETAAKGFRQTIDDAIDVVEAERKAQQERELAANMLLEKARQKATMVREIIIVPLLKELHKEFATARKKVLPKWEIQSDGDGERYGATAATPNLGSGGPPFYTIKAETSLVEGGAELSMSVVCSRVDPRNTSGNRVPPLYDKTKSVPIMKLDELGSQMWFQAQLAECARMCVLTKMRQSPNDDEDCVPAAAAAAT